MGRAVGWRGALRVPNMMPIVGHNTPHFFAVVLEQSVIGTLLAISPHISPLHEHPHQKEVQQQMSALPYP